MIRKSSRGYVKNFIRETRLENGHREMRSKGSGAADSEFIEIIMRIIEEEREFLEQIGRL